MTARLHNDDEGGGAPEPGQTTCQDATLAQRVDQIVRGPLTRRGMLTILGLAAVAAVITGCEANDKVVDNLPERALGPGVGGGGALVPDNIQYAPPTPPKASGPIRPVPAPTNTFGIVPRSSWARGGPNLKTIDPMNGVGLITFHHSGDPKPFYADDFASTAQHLEWVREYHVSRKFQDIGYHFAIDRAGRVWQLRSLRYQGQHVRYNNEHNIGVVVLGNFEIQQPTQAQKDRVKTFATTLRSQYKLPIKRVYTHREIVSTDCPGKNLQPYLVQIRKQGLV